MTQYAEAMGEALAQARMARSAGDVPVGAVVLDAHGEVIGRGRNLRERDADPLAHAEIVAMREAAAVRGNWNLADCTLVVTLEPCPMCTAACANASARHCSPSSSTVAGMPDPCRITCRVRGTHHGMARNARLRSMAA